MTSRGQAVTKWWIKLFEVSILQTSGDAAANSHEQLFDIWVQLHGSLTVEYLKKLSQVA